MADAVLLDAGPLGMLAHPRPNPDITAWLQRLSGAGSQVYVAEIADYEVRREFVRAGMLKSIRRLDRMKLSLGYVPITTGVMLLAADLWAQARLQGTPTAVDAALDGDVILAAQAMLLAQRGDSVTIATENVGHLGQFTAVRSWNDPAW
jgi:predicted nucleic acid-binding protein